MIPQCKQKDNYEVIVSLAEPTGADRKKVWMQKGKNLFNKNDYLSYVWFNMEGTIYKTGDNHIITDFIKVKPNTQYTFSTNTSIYLNLRGYDINKNQTKIIFDAITQTITFTTGENTYFIRVGIGNGLNYLDNNIQIEQGPTATEYEAYVEPKMYVLNDNDVYEDFINANKIDERINVLYNPVRKIINKTVNGVDFIINQAKTGPLVVMTITAQNVPANTNAGFFEVDYKPIFEVHAVCQYLGEAKGSSWIADWDHGKLWIYSTSGGTLQMDFAYFTNE